MRLSLLTAAALLTSTAAVAAEDCRQAGFRPGTPAFTACAMGGLDEMQSEVGPPDETPAAQAGTEEPRTVADVRIPVAAEGKKPPLQGNIVINGEVLSTQARPLAMVNGAPPPAPPPPTAAPSGFPMIVQPTMPVMNVPGWNWNGGGGMQ